ncbi:MAG: hypothetical protein LBE39_11910 [Flavobacteriaceae bacterium]|jgi:hypothetical protein|nr:hypothetical protein [Flavobacteriaceae bacterium]
MINNKMNKNDNEKKVEVGIKRLYVPPIIDITFVTLENCFANSSAEIILVRPYNVPTVTDWEEKKDEQDWKF